jgi:hypothetical protein
MKKLIIPLLILTIFILACNQNRSKDNRQMFINVDTTLLSKVHFDSTLKIEYKIPKSWVEFDLKKIDSSKKDGLLHYYIDTFDHKSALMIYDIRNLKTNQINNILNSPDKFINQNNYWDTIISDTFSFNNFNIHQLFLKSKQLIAFNLYFSFNNKYNFYTIYTSDIKKYQAKAKEIESSIGSFNKIK